MDSMDSDKVKPTCEFCHKEFASLSSRNKHLRNFHQQITETNKIQHILCPMCPEEKKFSAYNYNSLIEHLKQYHEVNVKESILHYRNIEEFEAWRKLENREVDYACERRNKKTNGEELIYYSCNRSDTRGHISICQKRTMKSGGSIKIRGICPSRIAVKVSNEGSVTARFIETHVGHADELRTKRLTTSQRNSIVEQLTAGVSNERIIKDARNVKDETLERLNLITRGDLAYLIRKFNIDKKRDTDDMIATALKVEEWNRDGKNHAFLFKKIGESYHGLKDDDFAVGYMNSVMEKKLREHQRTICVDGTHGTNRRNWDLTIVLVLDNHNTGFPVAFLLSNRLDQKIQELFFSALKSRLGEAIHAQFLMSDDDPKYYNAWTQVMATEEQPVRRLLCTWHIIKNWNIQGRSKIKKEENRKEMKKEMKNILKETDPTKFMEMKERYFKHLEDENETEFLRYLQRNYFQSEERIMMWAHCYRTNAGINTNMAIESLNKVLKYNKMNGKRNIRVEKLLDLLDEIVDEKMWKRIVNTERPNANNYQHRVTIEAHKKAEQITGKVEVVDGKFRVKSSVDEKFYFVTYNEFYDEDCKAIYCNICKICIHTYKCQCPEYTVKTALCKHIHAVALFEKRISENVSAGPLNNDNYCEDNAVLCIVEPTRSLSHYQEELKHFIEENNSGQSTTDFERRREETGTKENKSFTPNNKSFSTLFFAFHKQQRFYLIALQELCSFGRTLDEETFTRFMVDIGKIKNNLEKNSDIICKKRKAEKQLYYPHKKK